MSRIYSATEVEAILAAHSKSMGLDKRFPSPLPDDNIYILGAYIDVKEFRIKPRHIPIAIIKRSEIDSLPKMYAYLLGTGMLHAWDAITLDPNNKKKFNPQIFTFFRVTAEGTPKRGRWMVNWLHPLAWKEVLAVSNYVYVAYNTRPLMIMETYEGIPDDYVIGLCPLREPWWPEAWMETETEWPQEEVENEEKDLQVNVEDKNEKGVAVEGYTEMKEGDTSHGNSKANEGESEYDGVEIPHEVLEKQARLQRLDNMKEQRLQVPKQQIPESTDKIDCE